MVTQFLYFDGLWAAQQGLILVVCQGFSNFFGGVSEKNIELGSPATAGAKCLCLSR